MRRLVKKLLFLAAVMVILFGTLAVYLAATSARPQVAREWERLPNLPVPRGETAGAIGTRAVECPANAETCPTATAGLFVIGGLSGAGLPTARVDHYDPEGDRWARAPDLPQKRHHAAAAGLDGTVYLSGGAAQISSWTPERTFWLLRPESSSWETAPRLPEGRLGHQMIAVGRALYVIGGRGATSNVLIYDVDSQTWSIGAQMPVPRDHLGAVVFDNTIYAIGGRDQDLLRRVDLYDTTSDTWSDGPPLPRPMSAMSAAVLSDGIHVVGGEDPRTVGGGVIDRHYVLRPGAAEWVEASRPVVATHGSATGVLDGALVVAGGSRRQGLLSPLAWTGLVQAHRPR